MYPQALEATDPPDSIWTLKLAMLDQTITGMVTTSPVKLNVTKSSSIAVASVHREETLLTTLVKPNVTTIIEPTFRKSSNYNAQGKRHYWRLQWSPMSPPLQGQPSRRQDLPYIGKQRSHLHLINMSAWAIWDIWNSNFKSELVKVKLLYDDYQCARNSSITKWDSCCWPPLVYTLICASNPWAA